jgi:hypothetical protein
MIKKFLLSRPASRGWACGSERVVSFSSRESSEKNRFLSYSQNTSPRVLQGGSDARGSSAALTRVEIPEKFSYA